VSLPTHWLQPDVRAQVLLPDGAPSSLGVLLGPEPVIGEQRIVLRLDDQQVVVHTDGLSPFALESAPAATEGATSLRDAWPQEARHAPS
jgi:general secretion pathway protein H